MIDHAELEDHVVVLQTAVAVVVVVPEQVGGLGARVHGRVLRQGHARVVWGKMESGVT